MIKVGDYITLKDDIPDDIKKEGITVPIKVESIEECPYSGCDDCIECPGYINDCICFGRDWGFIVKLVAKDWDE